MRTGIAVRVLEVGHCVHPGRVVHPHLSFKPEEFPAMVALISHPTQGYILFDCGYSEAFFKATRQFPERLYAWMTPCYLKPSQYLDRQLLNMGVEPRAIQHIVVSHLHADHIAALHLFPHATVHVHQAALEFLQNTPRFGRVRKAVLKELMPALKQRCVYEEFDIDIGQLFGIETLDLKGVDIFGDGSLHLINLPGHARGHTGLLVKQDGTYMMLAADACWSTDNITQGIDPSRLSMFICDDKKAYRNTLQQLRHWHNEATVAVTFLPTHCKTTVRDYVRQGWI